MSAIDEPSDDLESLVLKAQSAATSEERRRLEGDVIIKGRPMTRGLAHRYAHRGAELDDLRAVADAALLGAARRFDVTRGHFVGYATVTILGEIKRYFRDSCWMVRPSRKIQELHPRVSEASFALTQRGIDPSAAAIADHLQVPVEDVEQALAAQSCFSPVSLDAPVSNASGDDGTPVASVDPGYEVTDNRLLAAWVCASLTPGERELLRLRFGADLTQQQIATVLGRSQMQISRDLRRILAALRSETGLDRHDRRMTA